MSRLSSNGIELEYEEYGAVSISRHTATAPMLQTRSEVILRKGSGHMTCLLQTPGRVEDWRGGPVDRLLSVSGVSPFVPV